MVWSERNMSLKNPVTPPGIDPGTVRQVAQRLNHQASLESALLIVITVSTQRYETQCVFIQIIVSAVSVLICSTELCV